jgi:hypothetical protein
MELQQALKMVRDAGYRVAKPKAKKETRVGPTCVVMFADGIVTRMSTNCPKGVLDWARGMKLARYAYELKTKSLVCATKMVSVHFERDGVMLGEPLKNAA